MGIIYNVKARLPNSEEKIDLSVLIDTGAHHCIITKEMASKVNLFSPDEQQNPNNNQVILDAFNESAPVLGVCSLEIQMNIYQNPTDPPVKRLFPIIADIVETLDFKSSLYDSKVDLILGVDFMESNYIGIDFLNPKGDTKIVQRPYFDQVRLFQKRAEHTRDYFSMATITNQNFEPISPTEQPSQVNWYDRKFLLPVNGSLGSKTLLIGLNTYLPYSIISAQAVEHLEEIKLNFDPSTLEEDEDENDLKMDLRLDLTTTLMADKYSRIAVRLKNRTISFMVFVVEEIPHEFDVVIGDQEIDAEGLMIVDNELISKYTMTKM